MLVLTRKLNEKIQIGDDVTITIIKLRNNQIRIGIEAPRDVRVLRAELEKNVARDLSNASSAVDPEPKSENVATNNRVRTFLEAELNVADADLSQPRRNDVIDGLISADEMIAAGKDSDDERFDDDSQPGHDDDGGQATSTTLQVFSGRIDRNGEVRENKSPRKGRSLRAPLASFFTAP